MKKAGKGPIEDDMRAEYDFASMQGGVRGKYADRLRENTNVVILADDVAEAFPNDSAVNDALRAVLKAASVIVRPKRAKLTQEESIRRMELFPQRKHQMVESVRKSKRRAAPA